VFFFLLLFQFFGKFVFPQKSSRNSQIFTGIFILFLEKKIQNFLKLFPNFWCEQKKKKTKAKKIV
jgi:hypothetical protein